MMTILYPIEHLIARRLDEDPMKFPPTAYRQKHLKVIEPKVPTHYTTPGGGMYSARPDLTRSGSGVLAGRAAQVTGPAVVAVVGAHVITSQYDQRVVQKVPEHERSSFWQMFASGLTGTFGIGNAGLL